MERLIIFLISLCFGIYSAHKLSLVGTSLMLILAVILFFISKLQKKNDSQFKFKFDKYLLFELCALILIFGFGFLRIKLIDGHTNKKVSEILYESKEFEGMIVEADERKQNFKVVVLLDQYKEKIELYLSKDNFLDVYPGDRVKLKGILTTLKENSNLGMYNDKQNKNENGIFYDFSGTCISLTSKNNYIMSFFTRLRRLICKIFDKTMNEKSSSLLKAMIVGETQFLDSDFKELFKSGGVAHILAISGLHVSLIAGIVARVLLNAPLSDKTKILLSISIIVFYGCLTGLSTSTVRALLMIIMSDLGKLGFRNYDSRSGPFIAAFLMLMFKPIWLFSLGFILSFTSILAIRCKLPLKKLKAQSVNLSIFLFNVPILAYNFYTFSGLSVASNILIVPLAEWLVGLSFAIILSYFVNINVSIISGKIVDIIIHYFENVLTMLSMVKGFNITIGKVPLLAVAIWFISYILLYKYCKLAKKKESDDKTRRNLVFLILICVITIFILVVPKGKNYHATFLDVEHGDACVLWNDKKDECVLIDGGGLGNNTKDVGTYNVFPYIKYLGIRKINYAIVSHTDRDHIKGIIELCNLIDIENVIFPDVPMEGNLYENLIKLCKEKNINVYKLKTGDELLLGNMRFECVYPFCDIEKYGFDVNNSSLVLLAKIYDKKILFTGDIEEEAENLIVNSDQDIKCDILKIAHHGSKTSSTAPFVAKANPSVAVVSGNYSNMKTFNSVQKWKFKNVDVLSTYYNGMIEFTFKEA